MASVYLTTKVVKDSKPIAINAKNGEIIRLTEKKENTQNDEPFDYLDESLVRGKKKMNSVEIAKIKYALKKNEEPHDAVLREIYGQVKDTYNTKINTEFVTHDGVVMFLPTPKRADRIYLCGPTGVGKSTTISLYLDQYKKIYPDRQIFLFSDAPQDQILDKHGVIRIKLNEKLYTKPIQTMELENSCCIFDDVDSISDKKVKLAVVTLYDAILKKGSSKDNITLIVTNHAPSDYTATRNILINCNFIVFYPRSPVGIQYTLKKLGLDKEQINKLLNVPSRWVALHCQYPFYAVYEKGVFIL